jgi:hypothetical protein
MLCNDRERSGRGMHFVLTLTMVPQKFDVHAWAKFLRHAPATLENGGQRQSHSGRNDHERSQGQQEGRSPLDHRKDLLREGPALVDLHDRGHSGLRKVSHCVIVSAFHPQSGADWRLVWLWGT